MISLQRDKEASSGWELPVFHPLLAREQTITAVSWSAWQLTICQRLVAALREAIIVVNMLAIFFLRKKWCKYWQYFFISCKVAKFESFQQSRKLSAPRSTPSCSPSKSWLSSSYLVALGGQSLPHYFKDIHRDIRVVPNFIWNPWFQKWTKRVEENGAFRKKGIFQNKLKE